MAGEPQQADAVANRVQQFAESIVASPKLRAKFLDDSEAAVSDVVSRSDKGLRALVVTNVKKALDEQSPAAINAATIQHQFFSEAMRNPRTAFRTLMALSIGVFAVGIVLTVASSIALFLGDGIADRISAGVFGGAGVITTLGSIFTLTRRSVSEANIRDAQTRLIIAAFSTEMGNLVQYAAESQDYPTLKAVNEQLRAAMKAAVDLLGTQIDSANPTTSTATRAAT